MRSVARMQGGLGVVGLGLALLLSGCHAAPRAQFPSADSALGQLNRRTECSRAIQGEAELVASSALIKVRSKMLYMAQAKDRLRFDLYSDFGVTLSTLTTDGKKFSLYRLDEKAFWYGPAKTCNLRRFTQVALPPFALVELLRGRPPVLAYEKSTISYRKPLFARDRYVVDLVGSHKASQRIELQIPEEDLVKPLAEQRVRLLSVSVAQAGELLYEVELDDYRPARSAELSVSAEEAEMGVAAAVPSGPACDAELPGTLAFTVPGQGYKLLINNQQVFHNPGLLPGSFEQPVPTGVRTEHSDCSDE